MSRSTYYTARARTPKNCWTCDGITACRCSKEEIRAAKRAAKVQWAKEAANDYQDYLDHEVGYDYPDCGPDCSFCTPIEYWMDWLRHQDVYPPKPLPNPVLSKEKLAA